MFIHSPTSNSSSLIGDQQHLFEQNPVIYTNLLPECSFLSEFLHASPPANCRSKNCNNCNYLLESGTEHAHKSIRPMKSIGTVSAVLHHKGSTIWSVASESTVFEAIKMMADKNIGALLVMSGG